MEDPQHSLKSLESPKETSGYAGRMYRQANFHLNRALVKRLRRVFPRKYRLHEDLVKHDVVAILESFAMDCLAHLAVNLLLRWSRP
jgi:hypothetical protein